MLPVAICFFSLLTFAKSITPDYGDCNQDSKTIMSRAFPTAIDVSSKTGNIYYVKLTDDMLYVLKKGSTQSQKLTKSGITVNAIAVDNTAGKVYIGCEGLKVLEESTLLITDVEQVQSEEVYQLFMPKDESELYVKFTRTTDLFKYDTTTWQRANLNVKPYRGLGEFVVSKAGDLYFNERTPANDYISKVLLKGSVRPRDFPITVKSFAVDYDGKAYGIHFDKPTDKEQLLLLEPQKYTMLKTWSSYTSNIAFDDSKNILAATSDILVYCASKV